MSGSPPADAYPCQRPRSVSATAGALVSTSISSPATRNLIVGLVSESAETVRNRLVERVRPLVHGKVAAARKDDVGRAQALGQGGAPRGRHEQVVGARHDDRGRADLAQA